MPRKEPDASHGWSVFASPTTFSSALIAIWTGVLPIDACHPRATPPYERP